MNVIDLVNAADPRKPKSKEKRNHNQNQADTSIQPVFQFGLCNIDAQKSSESHTLTEKSDHVYTTPVFKS